MSLLSETKPVRTGGHEKVEVHGHSRRGKRTSTYESWLKMRQRCLDPNCPAFSWYGAKGITVCERWLSFPAFLEDMGEAPKGMTLDRKECTKGYYKENCRWATKAEQAANRGLFSNNRTGVAGVFVRKCGKVNAYVDRLGKRTNLYTGPDFFEAVCARKSWEAANAS